MTNLDYSEAYIFIRNKFIEIAEDEHVPISPVLGRMKEASIGGVIYSEWFRNRGFQIAVSHPDAPKEIDAVLTTMPCGEEDLPLIKLFSGNVTNDWVTLWKARCLWFDPTLSPRQAKDEITDLTATQ